MQRKSSKAILPTALILVCSTWALLVAQTSGPSALESQLETVYKVTQFESNTKTVIAPGALLRLTKANLLYETPIDNMFRCNANVRPDKAQIPGGGCIGWTKDVGAFLPAGQLLYISKIKVNAPKDIVTFELVEAAAGPNGTAAWPKFKTGVNFVFQPGYLAKADPGQIADLINTVLPLDGETDNSQAAQPAPAPVTNAAARHYAAQSQPQPQATGGTGQQVQLGMTEDEVKGILGQPTSSSQYSNMTVYVYQKMITFQNGKVATIR